MPLYEYECDACGKRFEKIQKFSDPPADICAHCGKGPVQRLLSSPAIQFKGSGWYVTDYSQKGKQDSTSSGSKSEAKGETKTKTETKTDTSAKSDTSSKTDSSAKTDTKSS
jgi:putative FmdB family regulatory protein